MVHLNGISWWVLSRIREWRVIEYQRCWSHIRRYHEGLDAEAADEHATAPPELIGFDITLIPGHAKGHVGHLDDEEVEVRVGRQAAHFDEHLLDCPLRLDPHLRARMRETCLGTTGNYHFEADLIMIFIAMYIGASSMVILIVIFIVISCISERYAEQAKRGAHDRDWHTSLQQT